MKRWRILLTDWQFTGEWRGRRWKRNGTRDRHTQTNTQSESKFNTRTSSGVDGRYYDNFVSFTFYVCCVFVCVMMFFTRFRTILLKKFMPPSSTSMLHELYMLQREERRTEIPFLCQWLALHLHQNHKNTHHLHAHDEAKQKKAQRKER